MSRIILSKGYTIQLEDPEWSNGAIVEHKYGSREQFKIISVRYDDQLYNLRSIKGKNTEFSLSFSHAHAALKVILDVQSDFNKDLSQILTED